MTSNAIVTDLQEMDGATSAKILAVRNLGPITLRDLQTLGLRSQEDLATLGWQEVCSLWLEEFPERANLNAFAAVIGAIDDVVSSCIS